MTNIYNSIIIIVLAIVLSNCQNSNRPSKEGIKTENSWVSLFNGVDLDNWNVKIKGHPLGVNWNDTFIVVDSAIRVNYKSYTDFDSSFGHIFYKNPYSNYKLKLNYRFIGEQISGGENWALKNSGVMVHSQSPESMALNQDFPVSLEVQLLGGLTDGEKRSTGNLCTPGTHVEMNNELVTTHCINSNSETYYNEEWVELEVVVWNDSILSHFINGKKVIEYTKPVIGGEYNTLSDKELYPLKNGFISLQSESHPVEFKNIMLLEL
jgi:hypothetical protein